MHFNHSINSKNKAFHPVLMQFSLFLFYALNFSPFYLLPSRHSNLPRHILHIIYPCINLKTKSNQEFCGLPVVEGQGDPTLEVPQLHGLESLYQSQTLEEKKYFNMKIFQHVLSGVKRRAKSGSEEKRGGKC